MSASTLIIILDVLFVVFLIIGFFQGFYRGVKRSALELGLTIAGIVVAGLLTPIVTNALLGIKVNGDQTINQYFIQLLKEDQTIGTVIESSSSLESFLQSLPQFLFCAIVFLVLNILVHFVFYILYLIISAIAFKSKKKEKQLGLKRNRWVGGLIGFAKIFIFVLAISMPLTSLVKLANSGTEVLSASAVETEQAEKSEAVVPEQLTEALDGVNRSAFGVLNGAVGLDDFMFDNISKIDINDGTVYLRQDLKNYIQVFDAVVEIKNSATDKFVDLDWETIDSAYIQITESSLYDSVVLNVVAEMVENYENLVAVIPQISDYATLLEDVKTGLSETDDKTGYFKNDIDKAYDIFSSLCKSGVLDELIASDKNVEDVLADFSNNNKQTMYKVFEDLTHINVVQDAFSSVIDKVKAEMATSEFAEIILGINTKITDWSTFGKQLGTAFEDFGEISKTLKEQSTSVTEISTNMSKILALSEDSIKPIFSKIGELLDLIDNLEISQTETGEKLIPKVLDYIGIEGGNILDVQGESISDYKSLFEYLSSPVEKIINIDFYSTIQTNFDVNEVIVKVADSISAYDSAEGREYSTILSDIILPIYKISALHDLVFDELINQSSTTGIIDLSLLDAPGFDTDFEACYSNWENDLPLISQILFELNDRYFDDNQTQTMLEYLLSGGDINEVLKKLDDEAVDLIVPPIMQAISMEPLRNKISSTILDSLADVLDPSVPVSLNLNGCTFDPANSEDQTSEITQIVKKVIAILKSNTEIANFKELNQNLLGELLETIKLNAYRVELSNNSLKEKGAFRSVFKALILQAENEFNVNFTKIFNVKHIYQVDFTEVFKLIELASQNENSFAEAFKDLVIETDTSTSTTEEKIDAVLGAIQIEENQKLAEEILSITDKYQITVKLSDEDKPTVEGKIEDLEKGENLSADLIQGLKNLFGLEN